MRLTPENKRKITERIRAGAAKAFRADGFDAVNLDRLMKEAELTRGAFYAHYTSKGALFADVMRNEHPLLRMLQRRSGASPHDLYEEMVGIFEGYLDVANIEEVFKGCSLAALTGDATRAGRDVREGYDGAFTEICEEMAREQSVSHDRYATALVLASGAVRTARAMADRDLQATVLSSAFEAFKVLLPNSNDP